MIPIGQLLKAATSRNGAAIADLFGGDNNTRPNTKAPAGVDNAAVGFTEFWAAWPSDDRKVAKQKCLDKWVTLGCARDARRIILHVEHMKKSDSWLRGFVPQPITYLNQERWSEWQPPVERRVVAPVITAQVSDEHKAKATGMPPEMRARLAELKRQRTA